MCNYLWMHDTMHVPRINSTYTVRECSIGCRIRLHIDILS
jgi:hypothetical protein